MVCILNKTIQSKKKYRQYEKITKRVEKIQSIKRKEHYHKLKTGIFDVLPIEILYLVTDKLSLRDIIKLSQTCHTMNNLCANQYVTRNHVFKFHDTGSSHDSDSSDISKVMDAVYNWDITSICLSDTRITDQQIKEITFFSPGLHVIYINNCPNITNQSIYHILDNCLNLTTISCATPQLIFRQIKSHAIQYAEECLGKENVITTQTLYMYQDWVHGTGHSTSQSISFDHYYTGSPNMTFFKTPYKRYANYQNDYIKKRKYKQFTASNIKHQKKYIARPRGATMGKEF
jgi:hypothetical protein